MLNQPNILWISLEDTSPRFGCYGDEIARTPNLDKLAAQSCRFPNAFSVAGVCAPSRSAIITGMYPTAIGTHHMRTTHTNEDAPGLPTPYAAVPPPYVKTFTEYLRVAGYFCTNNAKTDYQFPTPITAWDECHPDAHWRNRIRKDQPFFAVFNPTGTHESGMWEKEDSQPVKTDPTAIKLPPYLPDTPKSRRALARHYDNIEVSDQIVGNLLQQLDEDGLTDNTIVMIWSDHGEGLPRAKRWPYDAGIRIPLIVRYPGSLEPDSVNEQLVSLIDLGPTVLSLAGIPLPTHMHGQPFLGSHKVERQYAYATRDRYDESYDMVRAVRDRRFKYIRNYYPNKERLVWVPYRNRHPIMQELWRLKAEDKLEGHQKVMFQKRLPEELYDTATDPHELNNLVQNPDFIDQLSKMRQEMEKWQAKYDKMGQIPEEIMVRQWYPEGKQQQTAKPVMIPIAPHSDHHPGQSATDVGGTYDVPILVQLNCSTQGASIAYQIKDSNHWNLYTEPIRLTSGTTTIRTKAIRIGYKESGEQIATFTIS